MFITCNTPKCNLYSFESVEPSNQNNQGFEFVGSLSSIIAQNYINVSIHEFDNEKNQLIMPQQEPEYFSVLIPENYNGKALPLWQFKVKPNYEYQFSKSNQPTSYGCGALIVNDKQQVLLILRSDKCRNDIGLWSQAGGGIDTNEEPSEAIIKANIKREIKEELGVDIAVMDYLVTSRHHDDQVQWVSYAYLAKIISGTPTLMEPEKHLELKWFHLDDMPDNTNKVTTETVQAYKKAFV